MKDAPRDSPAYLLAARVFLGKDLTIDDIALFRTTWSQLPEVRREAIAISLNPAQIQRHDQIVTVFHGYPSVIELVTRPTERPVSSAARPRWMDLQTPFLRAALWAQCDEACADFTSNLGRLGDEPSQATALILKIFQKLREKERQFTLILERAPLGVSFELDYFVFSNAQENTWGSDFAFVICYANDGGISFSRFVVFQAKLVKANRLRIDREQLRNLLRTSWHGSLYVVWGDGVSPHSLPAWLLHRFLEERRSGSGPLPKSPTVRWSELSRYCNSLGSVLGDQFFCGELGDPLEGGTDASSVARLLAAHAGTPRHGVAIITLRQSGGIDGASYRVAAQPVVLEDAGEDFEE